MDKKQIIQITVIVVALGGAAMILYNGLFKDSGESSSPASATAVEQQEILPYGSSLDFDKAINPDRFQYGLLEYPKLDPQNEVGIPEYNLIIPASPSEE